MTTTERMLPTRCLIDTNVLLRLTQAPAIAPAVHSALQILHASGTRLYTSFQNLAEYWNVSTRPEANNGYGLTHEVVRKNVAILVADFTLITEDREVFERWLALVSAHRVSGRQVHDARLVAHMLVRDIPALLTANTKDFERYPEIRLFAPEQMVQR